MKFYFYGLVIGDQFIKGLENKLSERGMSNKDVSEIIYNFVNEILKKVREIEDLIDKFEVELLRDELEKRLKSGEFITLENPQDVKKLLQEVDD